MEDGMITMRKTNTLKKSKIWLSFLPWEIRAAEGIKYQRDYSDILC